jgi:hypothetical protein
VRILVAVVVWAAAIAAAAGLSSAVAGSIHNSSTSTSSASATSTGSTAGSTSTGTSTTGTSTAAAPIDPNSVTATAQVSLFQPANLTRALAVARSKFGANARVDNFALYPGYVSMTILQGGKEADFYFNVSGTSTTAGLGSAVGAGGGFKLSDVQATAPAILAARISASAHLAESRLHYMVAHVDPVSGRFQWLVYPVSGSRAEYFRANGEHAPLFEYTGTRLVRLPG